MGLYASQPTSVVRRYTVRQLHREGPLRFLADRHNDMPIHIFIRQRGSKNNKTSKVIFLKQRKLNYTRTYENLTKYYRLLQNLQKQFTVEL